MHHQSINRLTDYIYKVLIKKYLPSSFNAALIQITQSLHPFLIKTSVAPTFKTHVGLFYSHKSKKEQTHSAYFVSRKLLTVVFIGKLHFSPNDIQSSAFELRFPSFLSRKPLHTCGAAQRKIDDEGKMCNLRLHDQNMTSPLSHLCNIQGKKTLLVSQMWANLSKQQNSWRWQADFLTTENRFN